MTPTYALLPCINSQTTHIFVRSSEMRGRENQPKSTTQDFFFFSSSQGKNSKKTLDAESQMPCSRSYLWLLFHLFFLKICNQLQTIIFKTIDHQIIACTHKDRITINIAENYCDEIDLLSFLKSSYLGNPYYLLCKCYLVWE